MAEFELTARDFERGETFRGRLTVTLPGGDPKPLTGASVEWNLVDGTGTPVFTPSKTLAGGVTFEGSPTLGVLVVVVTKDESAGLTERPYVQEWGIVDDLGDRQIYRGQVMVNAAVLPVAA